MDGDVVIGGIPNFFSNTAFHCRICLSPSASPGAQVWQDRHCHVPFK